MVHVVCISSERMITHVIRTIMGTITQTFLVTIEIDPNKAMPCHCGHNHNTFPDWTWKYHNREQNFINEIWEEFRSCFKYDGLKCQIFAVEPGQFSGIFVPTNDDKLLDAKALVEEVYEDIYPEIHDPPTDFDKERIEECEHTFAKLTDNFSSVQKYVEKIEYIRGESERQ